MPADSQSALAVSSRGDRPAPCWRTISARASCRRWAAGGSAELTGVFLGMISLLARVRAERAQQATGLVHARADDAQRLQRQGGFVEKPLAASHLFEPVRPVLRRDDEVLAARAGRGLAPGWIGPGRVAEAGAVFLAVDAVAPVAHAEHQAGVDEQAGVA